MPLPQRRGAAPAATRIELWWHSARMRRVRDAVATQRLGLGVTGRSRLHPLITGMHLLLRRLAGRSIHLQLSLGLAVVRAVARQWHGAVSVESTPGHGASFGSGCRRSNLASLEVGG